jgi:chromosome segregation ATPase
LRKAADDRDQRREESNRIDDSLAKMIKLRDENTDAVIQLLAKIQRIENERSDIAGEETELNAAKDKNKKDLDNAKREYQKALEEDSDRVAERTDRDDSSGLDGFINALQEHLGDGRVVSRFFSFCNRHALSFIELFV